MKEHVQKTGVRKYAGDDLIELQAEPLKVIQAFFKECGDCVINGCEVVAVGDKYNVSPGVVSLSGVDAEGEQVAKVATFAGVENVTLPIYLTLTNTVSERVYGDGKVKPIAYNYTATATNVHPEEGVSFLEITTTGGKQFVDAIKVTEKLDKIGNGKEVTVTFAEAAERVNVSSGEKLSGLFGKIQKWFAGLKTVAFTGKAADLTQDANNRLVTDTEKTGWNDKYTKTQTDTKDDDTLKAAKEHTNGVINTLSGDVYHKADTYNRTEINNKDAAALQAAKEYAAAKIAEVVNSAPGTLDTLQELATALGNDPNFATSITALIGGKADKKHDHPIAEITNLQSELALKANVNHGHSVMYSEDIFVGGSINFWYPVRIPIRGEGVNRFVIRRSIHEDSPNQGSLRAEFITTQSDWGQYVNFIKCINLTASNHGYIAKCKSDYGANMTSCVVWLRGSLTYHIDYYYVPNSSAQVLLETTNIGSPTYPEIVSPTTEVAAEFAGGNIYPVTSTQLNLKADSNHNHGDTYAPKEHSHNYAASNHTHNYEPTFAKKGAFNKDFGTAAGTVAQGNHTHPNRILCTGKVVENGTVSFITPGFTVNRMEKGIYRIKHMIGHTNYGIIGTGYKASNDVPTWIGMKVCTSSYCDVISYFGNSGFQDSVFSFTIFGL